MTDQEIMEMWWATQYRIEPWSDDDCDAFWALCDEFGTEPDIPF